MYLYIRTHTNALLRVICRKAFYKFPNHEVCPASICVLLEWDRIYLIYYHLFFNYCLQGINFCMVYIKCIGPWRNINLFVCFSSLKHLEVFCLLDTQKLTFMNCSRCFVIQILTRQPTLKQHGCLVRINVITTGRCVRQLNRAGQPTRIIRCKSERDC